MLFSEMAQRYMYNSLKVSIKLQYSVMFSTLYRSIQHCEWKVLEWKVLPQGYTFPWHCWFWHTKVLTLSLQSQYVAYRTMDIFSIDSKFTHNKASIYFVHAICASWKYLSRYPKNIPPKNQWSACPALEKFCWTLHKHK